jgi:hypothetical protein
MNVSEAMKLKTKIKTSCGIDLKMLDIPEDGLVLYVERKTLDIGAYKLLADFTAQNDLSLQLDIGNFIISTRALPPH